MVLTNAFSIVFALAGVICWLAPGAISGVGAQETLVIGSLFFVVAAILFMMQRPDDKAL